MTPVMNEAVDGRRHRIFEDPLPLLIGNPWGLAQEGSARQRRGVRFWMSQPGRLMVVFRVFLKSLIIRYSKKPRPYLEACCVASPRTARWLCRSQRIFDGRAVWGLRQNPTTWPSRAMPCNQSRGLFWANVQPITRAP